MHELVASRGHATSVALACCCKSLEDPVLDVLWKTQQELLPLLKSLPGDVWNESECTVSPPTTFTFSLLNYSTQKSFRRLPTTPEWARFRKYARRMRELNERNCHYSEVLPVLQFCATNGPLFLNLKTLHLWFTAAEFIPFIPSFLSPRTTSFLLWFKTDPPPAIVASMITALPTLCPDLQDISLWALPRHPMITAAVTGMLLASNRSLRRLRLDSPLTEEACEVVYKHPDLRELSVVIEGSTSLPVVELPNLTEIFIEYDRSCDWLQGFRGATLGKLASISFHSESDSTIDFLEEFKRVALTTSIPATLSKFSFGTSRQWKPNYRSLLPFTQLSKIDIEFSCDGGCSSTIDDDIITEIARAMPGLEFLHVGDEPCETPTGITIKGLATLAHYCPSLCMLRVHFQVASLDPLAIPKVIPGGEPTIPRRNYALTDLDVGAIPLPEESVLVVAQTLTRIFPRITYISSTDDNWDEVVETCV